MARIIYLKMTIDWENYEDVGNELIIEDSGILDSLKDGVIVEQIDAPIIIPSTLSSMINEVIEPHNSNSDKQPDASKCNSGLPVGFLFNEAGRVVLDPRYIPNIDDD
jgi:hypothetical protein